MTTFYTADHEWLRIEGDVATIGVTASAYLGGAVLGALFFGWLTDRLGRRKLFFITLAVYLFATAATALSWNLASFALFRFVTGAGNGRNSMVDRHKAAIPL